jgi:lysophospholipase L1-like esterase
VLTCPAPQVVFATGGLPAPVSYPPPTATGGTLPISIGCTPRSGSAFPVGESKVTCVATDALDRAAVCTFKATVQVRGAAPRLAVLRIMAFGNSITEGVDGDERQLVAAPYPVLLQASLNARYYDQMINVFNEGLSGEKTAEGLGRLPGRLAADRPDLLLLEEGTNDVPGGEAAISPMAENLRNMIKLAHARGVQVMIATLLPERAGPPRNNLVPAIIPPANDAIRRAAALEGVPVVDLYQAFGGSPDPYIGVDGLHPNQRGYQQISDLFFAAIRARFEVAPTGFPLVRRQ